MAGIGFELRKIISKSGPGSMLKLALSGTMIVAGPWLLSILSITLINRFMGFALEEDPKIFMAVIVYSYAFSLFIFGGFHYILTRILSDYIYEKKEEEAFSYLLLSFIPTAVFSLLISAPVLYFMDLSRLSNPVLFKFSAALLFSAINIIWITMLFVSVLKWHIKILMAYVAGMGCSLLLIYYFSLKFSIGGAMAGFALGHVLIIIMLLLICLKAFKPEKRSGGIGLFLSYLKKYKYLFFSGLFYYWGIWIDKMIFWVIRGEGIPGTFFKLYEPYDFAVYFANLTMIPGLIYFVVFSETGFYIQLRKFLTSLLKNKYSRIQKKKYNLIKETKKNLYEQSFFQGVVTLSLIILSPILSGTLFSNLVAVSVLQITLTAVFFHLFFLTLLNFLFYLELYYYSFISVLVFFIVNLIISVITAVYGGSLIPGLSYLSGGVAGSAVSMIFLYSSMKKLDRYILGGMGIK